MSCEWSRIDCKNDGTQCYLCVTPDMFYIPKQIKKKPQLAKRQQKADSRMGSQFEFKNHQNNAQLLNAESGMTPNSGAGHIKGDEQIRGIIDVMEELKTKVIQQAPGKETFTIQRKWLDKLHREAMAVNKEFWYLKFSFFEHDQDIYCITEQDIIMSFVKTIVEERKIARRSQLEKDVAEKQRRKVESDLYAAQAEIELLKAQLALKESA